MKAFLKGLAAIAVLVMAVNTASAGFLSTAPPNINLAEFLAEFETATTSPLVSTYNFGGGATDGQIVSQVFQDIADSANTATGLFAYLYQIQNTSAGGHDVTTLIVDWSLSAFESYPGTFSVSGAGSGPVFEITTGTEDVFTFSSLEQSEGVTGIDFDRLRMDYTPDGTSEVIAPGESSAIVVVFSEQGPTVRPVKNMVNDASLSPPLPSTYVPTPEPATLALLLAGAPVGLVALRRRRKTA